MNRVAAHSGLMRGLAALWVIAIVTSGACVWRAQSHNAELGVVLLFGALTLAAELLPVELRRRGVRITFALPFVASLAVYCGGPYALIVDMTATATVGFLMMRSSPVSSKPKWIGANAAIAAICASVGSLIVGIGTFGRLPAEALVILFIATYALANWALVAYVEWFLTGKMWSDHVGTMGQTAIIGFTLYSLVGLLVAVMLRELLYFAIPLTLIPIWALRTGLAYRNRMDDVYYETITALTQMLQRAHPYTHGHLERVSLTAEAVARRLGLSSRRARLVREAAVLHDIGKIAINEAVLDKPDKLTDEEWEHVRLHPVYGAEILAPVRRLQAIAPWIRYHHERPDGTGYPEALVDAQIPIESKIIAVVDAFDAMTGDEEDKRRAYRKPMSEAQALDELDRCAGTQFDRAVVQAFRATVSGGHG